MDADNLLTLTKNFLTPEIVNPFSHVVGESTESTQKGLKSVIPSLLLGMANKGQSAEGAEVLIKLVRNDGRSPGSIQDLQDEQYLVQGRDAIKNIFGDQEDQVADNLGQTTGLQSFRIKELMILSAPILMGMLGKKMQHENLSALGLMGMLKQEKNTLSHLVPEGLVGRFSAGPHASDFKKIPTISPWGMIALIALTLLAIVWWYTGVRNVP